jgi:chromosome partitioning protein
VRKLLVASQKGGVGKTTSSVNLAAAAALAGNRVLLLDADPLSSISASLNLAAHPQRQTLRQIGVDLPGVLASNVLPGLDVLSPYEDGGCSDDELDGLLGLLATPAFRECYGCLIAGAPPFLGANPGQLLAACDEIVLVMRAEPMAPRTLPAFLELVQRSRPQGIRLRGILLTLPEGEPPGGRVERELRGRFGMRILPIAVPHDEAVSQASLFGQIVSQAHKDSPAGAAYHSLVESLGLAGDARETIERTSGASALLLAAAAVEKASVRKPPAARARPVPPVAAAPVFPVLPLEQAGAPPRPLENVPAPREGPDLPVPRRLPPAFPVGVEPLEGGARAPAAARQAPARPREATGQGGSFPLGIGLLWVGLAMVAGVVLRFLTLPDDLVPVLVGVGVAAAVVLLLRHFQARQGPRGPAGPSRKPAPRRAEGRPDPGKRLSGLKRRVTTSRAAREK